MKILVLNGSPKAHSDTMHITRAFLEGMNEETLQEIEIIDVIKKDIKPCLGCFACWKNSDAKCIQKDFQNEILEKIILADVIIWSFPLYCYGMPSHLKAVVDRTIPLSKMSMREKDGEVVHDTLFDLSSKNYIVLSGCGFPDWEGNFEGLKIQCRNMFGGHLDIVCVPETPMLSEPTAELLTTPLKEKFKEAGKEYAQNLTLTEETIKVLETPMLPNETYIKILNANAVQ